MQDGTRLSDKDTLKTPFIAVLGRDLLNVSQYTIIVEKQALVTVSDFRKALVTLIASYYCFNIQYPKEATNTFLFIERYLIGITIGPRLTPSAIQTISAIEKLKI